MPSMRNYYLHILSIFLVYQVLIGNQGSKWVHSDLLDLERAADEGDAYALGYLALCHAHGDKGLKVSATEAQFFADRSALQDHWLGHFVLGYLHYHPPLGPDKKVTMKRYLQAFRDPDGSLIKLAAQNDPVAQFVLGEIFTAENLNPYVQTDLSLASQYYVASARNGHSLASLQIGLIKIHGVTDASDDSEQRIRSGIDWLTKATDMNLPAAHYYLGRCFLEGTGLNQDVEMALVHFQASADRGFGLAQLVMSDLHAQGIVGPIKLELALDFAKKAAELGLPEAKLRIEQIENALLGESPDSSDIEETKDLTQADNDEIQQDKFLVDALPQATRSVIDGKSKMILPPASYGVADSDFEHLPESNVSMGKRIQKIDSIVKKSSASDHESAENLREQAKRLYWKKGDSGTLRQASELFEMSAELGDAEAARYLGLMYLQGKGVSKNPGQAMKWFETASFRGDEMAKRNLASLQKIIR